MDSLPDEILIKIFGFLHTSDLFQFLNVYDEYSYLLKERRVIQILNFKFMWQFSNSPITQYILNNIGYSYIKVLNINSLYWIPLQDIRELLSKLHVLEEFYALDTNIGVRDEDILLYGRLKKLSISVEPYQLGNNKASDFYYNCLYTLQKLCLKFSLKKDNFDELYIFLSGLKNLTELWIYDNDEENGINYERIIVSLSTLNKLVIKSRRALSILDLTCWGLIKTFQSKKYEFAEENIFERVPLINTENENFPETSMDKSWEILRSLHCDILWGPNDSKEIYIKKSTNKVYFEDLNFCHAIILCNSKYIDAALKILSYKNSSRLKRLSFRSCLFQNHTENSKEEPTSGFKRSRKGVQISSSVHPFQTTANNLKNLRELEIFTCSGCTTAAVISAYSLIGTFEYLEKLTLEIPLLLDGSFLREVFIKCSRLESLYLFCKGQNDRFVSNLCQNLKFSQNLRHFRLDHNEIPISRLLTSFNEVEEKKLLRIFVKCDKLRGADNSEESFSAFMDSNPQLIFCVFVIGANTKKQNSDLQYTINKFKDGNSAKVFHVKKDISSFSGVFPIPAAHHDIIFYRTNVAVINIDDF